MKYVKYRQIIDKNAIYLCVLGADPDIGDLLSPCVIGVCKLFYKRLSYTRPARFSSEVGRLIFPANIGYSL